MWRLSTGAVPPYASAWAAELNASRRAVTTSLGVAAVFCRA
jgi:hypothetical protein